MKTPEQIAAELDMPPSFFRLPVGEQLELFAIAAIESDRAQRATIDPDWLDDQGNVRYADHVDVSWRARDDRGRVLFESDMTLTAEQAVGMFQGIGQVES